jgi:TatD DNase family protein
LSEALRAVGRGKAWRPGGALNSASALLVNALLLLPGLLVFVDSHCHLNFPELAGQMPSVLEAMAANRVTHALCISVNLEEFPAVLGIAAGNARIYATVGVHPDTRGTPEPAAEDLVALAARPKVVAIGETGLDYYRLSGDLEWQRARFRNHIRAARECGKPLVIHTRAAAADTLAIMREERAGETGGVMHCFTESWETAQGALELGFHVSFSGIVTFNNAAEVKEVARRVPLDRMLIETDAPYLAPVPFRGRTNQPAYVRYVAEEIARLRGAPVEEIAAATSANFFRLFGVRREQ